MGLQPLEFSDCLTDSPYFRENLHSHEKELERTSKAIKGLINECKELINAAKTLSKAQRNFSNLLVEFKFDTIGSEETDDEKVIAAALKEFGKLISMIEDHRDMMLERAFDQIIHPLENFRKDQIGAAKEHKKKFDKQTGKFVQSQDRYLNLKTKAGDNILQEADATLEMERRHFFTESMHYVLQLQEVQERKKFEFVETLLGFMYGWLTFYHQGHEVSQDFKPFMTDLQVKLQKCRTNFDISHNEAEQLMNRMLEKPQEQQNILNRTSTKEGYLFLMEKKALGTTWSKYYCQYQKENKILTMIPYSQQSTGKGISTETVVLTSCTRRAGESIDKRFCFDITVDSTSSNKGGPMTLQAMSEEDRRLWLDAMDGREPIYMATTTANEGVDGTMLDDIGFSFVKKCIHTIETKGLNEQGLYRVVGVHSKVSKLVSMGLDRRKCDKLCIDDEGQWEIKTVTSALKHYFRSLPEPLLTFKHHESFIAAAKRESKTLRVNDIHELIHQLPEANFDILSLLMAHLKKVSSAGDKNLMTVSNLGVCFGPTLLRPREETFSAIMDIKFCNIVVEILIENYEKVMGQDGQAFKQKPCGIDITQNSNTHVGNSTSQNRPSSTGEKPPKPALPPPPRDLPDGHPAKPRAPPPPSQPPPGIPNHRKNSTSSIRSSCSEPGMGSAQSQQPGYVNLLPIADSNNTSGDIAGVGGGGQTYAQYRAKLRPTTGYYSQFSPDLQSSTSSSSESLNSKGSSHVTANNSHVHVKGPKKPAGPSSASSANDVRRPDGPTYANLQQQGVFGDLHNLMISTTKFNQQVPSAMTKSEPGSSSTSSVSSLSSAPTGSSPQVAPSRRKVRTLYSCEAENDSELSFEPNQIIFNVRQSREPGWLEGSLDGKNGLIPANYVEYLN